MHDLQDSFVWRWGGLSLSFAILLCAATGCGGKDGNRAYQGRSLLKWVDQLGNPKLQGEERQKAILAVQSMGTNAVPILIAQINMGNAIDGQRRMGVVAALEILEAEVTTLPALGEVAVRGDDRSADSALWALSRMGNPGVEAMTNALANSSDSRRSKVVQMLHSMGTNAHVAVPSMLWCLRNAKGDYDIAFWAGCGAARASLLPSEVVHNLTTNLFEGDSACRYGSASGLRLLGSGAKEAIPALQALLSDTNEHVRCAASNALHSIEKEITR